MLNGLKQHPSLLSLRKQYEMLGARDRLALKWMAVALVVAIFYFAAWQPAYQYKINAQADLKQNQTLLALVASNRDALSHIAKQSQKNRSSLDSQQLVSSVTNLAKRNGVLLKRFEPSGDNKLKVWLDNASFDKVVSWLATMKQTLNITVEQISIEKDEAPGLVSARLTLSS